MQLPMHAPMCCKISSGEEGYVNAGNEMISYFIIRKISLRSCFRVEKSVIASVTARKCGRMCKKVHLIKYMEVELNSKKR